MYSGGYFPTLTIVDRRFNIDSQYMLKVVTTNGAVYSTPRKKLAYASPMCLTTPQSNMSFAVGSILDS